MLACAELKLMLRARPSPSCERRRSPAWQVAVAGAAAIAATKAHERLSRGVCSATR